jgi:sodium-coupled monocarboxylate transporter 8/12
VSSTLNSLSAVTLEDYFKPLYAKIKKTEWKATSATTSKLIAFVYGLVCIGGAFLAQFLGGILQASLTIFGVVGGPLLGLFTLGMATEMATEWGVIPAVIFGISFSVWIGFSPKPPPDRQLEFSTEDCSEFGGFNKTTNASSAVDDKK